MAIVKIIDENRTVTDRQPVAEYLMACGVRYECWTPAHPVEADSPAEEILQAYASEIERLKALGDT
jgi:cupin superfamily acireductone dioxygenase involved in methionine salvage